MESILESIKKLLGISEEYTHFDSDIVMHINSVMLNLKQIGVIPESGYLITGSEETWDDICGDRKDLEAIKSYIYLKVRLLFDPPTSTPLIEAIKSQISELEWRLYFDADLGTPDQT